VDGRCDIFALGLVIFEFLTGRCAFTGDNDYAVVNRIVAGTTDPFVHPNAILEERVRPIIERALKKNPDERYRDADEIADELGRVRQLLESPSAETRMTGVDAVIAAPAAAPEKPTLSRAETTPMTRVPHATAAARSRLVVWGLPVTALGAGFALALALWGQRAAPPVPEPAAAPQQSAPPPPAQASPLPEAPAPTSVPASTSTVAAPVKAANPVEAPARPTVDPRIASGLSTAQAAATAGDYDAAVAAFEDVLKLDPRSAAAEQGLQAALRGQTRARQSAIKAKLAEAAQKHNDGAYDEEIAAFQSVLKLDPENPEATQGIERARNAKAAEESLKRPLKKPPADE
jgi:tetratricopeptide (TPR) repeat protein